MNARALALGLAAALLCGCSGLPRAPSPAADLVGYFAAVSRQGASGQKQALAEAAQAFGRDPTPYARLRLGGLHAQPAPVLRDDARALALLEPLQAAKAPAGMDPALADLAALMYAQAEERLHAAREESRKLEALRAQNEAMKERLGALRAIDRAILQREDRQPVR